MIKKRYGLFVNIATICLCVCAIAVGVYSAKQAQVNMTTKLGFTARDCMLYLDATVHNVERRDASGGPTGEITTKQIQKTIKGGNQATTNSIDLGKLYFVKGENSTQTGIEIKDMVFRLCFKNYGTDAVKVTFTQPTVNGGLSLITKDSNDPTTSDYITFTNGQCVTVVSVNQTQEIAFAIRNSSMQEVLPDLSLEFNIRESEFNVAELNDYMVTTAPSNTTVIPPVTTNKLVVNMGTWDVGSGNRVPIRWYAFAVKGYEGVENDIISRLPAGENSTHKGYVYDNKYYETETSGTGTKTDRWYSLFKVDMTNFDTTGKQFWFIQEYVTASHRINANNGKVNNSSPNTYANTDRESDMYHYLTSKEYQLCDGTTLNNGYINAEVSNITNEILYAGKIVERAVNETYTGLSYGDGTQTNNLTSKLWLLSQAELGLAYGGEWTSGYKAVTYGISQTTGTGYGDYWWLRSPYPSNSGDAYYVYDDGSLDSDDVSNNLGVRSAFQIQM